MSYSTMGRRQRGKQNGRVSEIERNGKADNTERDLLRSIRQLGSDVTGSLKKRTAGLRETAADSLNQSRKQLHSLKCSAKKRIKQRPFASLAIAAGAGLLIGWCIKRRR
jgi:ElaB/YqjD/DUF883 family membrane-anchored ribosome-binding protein